MGKLANDVAGSGRSLSGGALSGGVAANAATTGWPDDSVVSVRDLLTLSAFAGTRVVAGSGGLDRVVDRANIMEVPDIVPWVKPHELLLTTGYPLRDAPQGLAGLVGALDDAGVAALAVKLRRYLDELSADMLAEADRRGFPVLLLPDDVGFDDLLNAVLSDVLNRQSAILERSESVHRALVSVLLDGGGLDDLVRELHALTGDLTFVTTPDGRLLAAAGDDATAVLTTDTLCTDSGRFRSERFAGGAHELNGLAVAVVPVLAARTDHGRLVVLRSGRRFNRGDMHALERAAAVVALAITKSVAVQAVEAKYRGDFVRDVLLGRAGSAESVIDHFTSLGWDVARPLAVVVAALDPSALADLSRDEARTAQDRFAAAWMNVVGRHDRAAPVVGFAAEVVTLVGVPRDGTPRAVVDALVQQVSGDGGGGRRTFATGVSRVTRDPTGIAGGYEQARRAVHVGRQLQGPGSVAHFDDLGAFRLLSLIDDVNELGNFVSEVLHELAAETDPEAADLRQTLRTLLDTNLNVAETSRQLHFHYNTLRYRIAKLERIVGPFTQDPDLQLDLSLALRVLQMKDG
jgi:DNA-binding PucR family transcriptional regulator